MNNPSLRQAAWEFVQDATKRDSYINLEIERLHQRIKPEERAFATELIYGSTRMRLRLDYAIDSLIERSIDDELRELLRLGFYEVIFMTTADHALVNEYVETAKRVLGKARSSFVNALLRRACRERDSLQSNEGPSLDIGTSHPRWIVEAFNMLLEGDELSTELMSHNVGAPIQAVFFDPVSQDEGKRDTRLPHGYILTKPPSSIEAIRDGIGFIQDFGSQLICEVALATDASRDLKWLDMCAGPGGKFSYLAHYLTPKNLTGIELHNHRAELIRRRVKGYEILIRDGRDSGLAEASVDRILLDAPCTGLGALRRRPDARWRRDEGDLKALVKLQRELLDSSALLVRPGGIIAYATCSPHPLETRAQVADFLNRHQNFRLLPIEEESMDASFRSAIGKDGMMQLMTARHGTDGMFLALLQKTNS